MNHDADNIFTWKNFQQSSTEVQAEILAEMDLDNCLPDLPYKEQAKVFIGASADIILKYLPLLSWDAQLLVWKNSLPTGARDEAWKLLHEEARSKLKPRERKMCLA